MPERVFSRDTEARGSQQYSGELICIYPCVSEIGTDHVSRPAVVSHGIDAINAARSRGRLQSKCQRASIPRRTLEHHIMSDRGITRRTRYMCDVIMICFPGCRASLIRPRRASSLRIDLDARRVETQTNDEPTKIPAASFASVSGNLHSSRESKTEKIKKKNKSPTRKVGNEAQSGIRGAIRGKVERVASSDESLTSNCRQATSKSGVQNYLPSVQ